MNTPDSSGSVLFESRNAAILLLDHQAGLLQTVKDIGLSELRANVSALAKLSTVLGIPVITSASEPSGPNGPLMPEIHRYARHAQFVPRQGEVSAWENEEFVRKVRSTGRQTLIIAGVWTSVCVAFPALAARAEGYRVYAVIDASGDPSELSSRVTLARLVQGGVIPTSTHAVISEMQRRWRQATDDQFAELYAEVAPSYRAVMESYFDVQQGMNGRRP